MTDGKFMLTKIARLFYPHFKHTFYSTLEFVNLLYILPRFYPLQIQSILSLDSLDLSPT